MRNSDPRLELSLFTDSILISTPYLPCKQLVVTSNTGSTLVFPRIQPFRSVDFASRGKVYSRHVTGSVDCKNSSVSFVMKYCPTSTVFRTLASVQILINRSCCLREPFHSFCTFAINFLVQELQSKVKVLSSTILLARTMGQIVLPARVFPFLLDKHCIHHANLRLLKHSPKIKKPLSMS